MKIYVLTMIVLAVMVLAAIVTSTQHRVELYNGHIVWTPSRVPDLDSTSYGMGFNDR